MIDIKSKIKLENPIGPPRLRILLVGYICFSLLFQAGTAVHKASIRGSWADRSLVFILNMPLAMPWVIGRHKIINYKPYYGGERGLTAENYSIQQDKELVARCLSGNQEAWSHLYRRLYRTANFITHWNKWGFSQDQAEEIMQETFTGLITSLKAFKFDCSLETFVSNIAERKCISELRRITALKREAERNPISMHATNDEGELKMVLEDNKPSSVDELQRSEVAEVLKAALISIGDKCRRILQLKYYENFSYDDIAGLLNIPRGTVASRLKRCLLELRDLYTKLGGESL
jgi:RNA polymerase sigma-70 factor (ECF subfamily)